MSILIKGMEMPKNCFDCPLFDDVYTDGLGVPLDYYQASGETKKDCPLVPVPPHGRLIDADALTFSRIRIAHEDGVIGGYNAVVMSCAIKDAPTIIPADPEGEET